MRILVCGSRNFNDRALMEREFEAFPPDAVIVEGDAPGADSLAGEIAETRGMPVERYPADWKTHGKAAGPIRNQQMLDSGVDLVVAFPLPGCKGTWDMVNRAKRAGVEVHIIAPVAKKATP